MRMRNCRYTNNVGVDAREFWGADSCLDVTSAGFNESPTSKTLAYRQ